MACLIVCAEYRDRGHISTRTDSFAFGIIAIELLTGMQPKMARGLVDDSLFEELPALIQRHYSIDEAALPSTSELMCEWPVAPLHELSMVAARCARLQSNHRAPIAEALPELERLVAMHRGLRAPA